MTEQIDWRAKQLSQAICQNPSTGLRHPSLEEGAGKRCSECSGLPFGRSEVLRSLRHYPRAQSEGHHTIDRLEERGVERGSGKEGERFSLIFVRTRWGHRQSDERWNRFQRQRWETAELELKTFIFQGL